MAQADWSPRRFTVGQHESDRKTSALSELCKLAADCNYDMLTVPITTSHFQSRVLAILSGHLSAIKQPAKDEIGTYFTSRNTVPLIIPTLSPADTYLRPDGANSQVVAVASRWIDICSPDPLIADISRQILIMELAYAAFSGVHSAIIPGPKLHHGNLQGEGLVYYARAIQEVLSVAPFVRIHIWFNMIDDPELEIDEIGDLSPFARLEYLSEIQPDIPPKLDIFGTWDAWNVIRKVCKYHSRLVVALSLPRYLPQSEVQSRWLSEPVRILTLHATAFVKNQKGFPVLAKAHQAYILCAMRAVPPWLLLCDVGPIPGSGSLAEKSAAQDTDFPTLAEVARLPKRKENATLHLSYLRNLEQKQEQWSPVEHFTLGYQDFLQAPLQPLTVNLESVTYEVFETDPIKYEWYERAIASALKDWNMAKKPTSCPDGRIVLAVVGAGRGPLVTRAIRASQTTGIELEVFALEKNQNAFVHLQRQNEEIWGGKVTLVQSDMRSWKGPSRLAQQPDTMVEGSTPPLPSTYHSPIDILVSELLGSFGDNELSPECLDGVQHLLNPTHGISIPASYSSHLTPISSPKLFADIQNQTISNPAAPEIPYVVMLHAFDYLSKTSPVRSGPGSPGDSSSHRPSASRTNSVTPFTEPDTPIIKTAWSFSHPNPNICHGSTASNPSNSHNTRQTSLTFPCREGGTCHGLGGYFESVLYGDVELSINPLTMDCKSRDMISWFPIYFPLKNPLYVPENSELVVTMFRQTDDRKVWYEWMVEVFKYQNVPTVSRTKSSLASSQLNANEKSLNPRASGGSSPSNSQLSQGSKDNATQPELKRIRIAMSDYHSSIRDGCLM
ncbi:methyltransferase protein [Myotisia sp. PD_48]|nr:methyltransferase protein [Myotisia sp. PD_48]